MKQFMDSDFLLDTETARRLFHNYAKEEPIFDFHNHLSPKDIANHRRFGDLTELWLETDHYKWRAMRVCGLEERLITGRAPSREKFEAWAGVLPLLAGSPLYHWTHLELQRYFGITKPLTPATADEIWEQTREMLAAEGFDAVSLLEKMQVRVLCTTDDPADDLVWHRQISEDGSIPFHVLPSFRPDKYLAGDEKANAALQEKYGAGSIREALAGALDYFCDMGCRVSDHGLSSLPDTGLMEYLGAEYARRGMVMQLHLGPLRNNSPRLFSLIGPDAGADSIGPKVDIRVLGSFLGSLEKEGCLPRTILYNLDPSDNAAVSTMTGNFAPQVQFGAAWWFNDNLRGIERQLDEMAEAGSLAHSVGMLTDSRSFTSFVRHEYFRRILCKKLGRLVEEGLYPNDEETLGGMVRDICYNNAVRFFAS